MNREQKSILKEAVRLFREGYFPESGSLFSNLGTDLPDDTGIAAYQGNIALLENRLNDAKYILAKAIGRNPRSTAIKSLLTYTYYRQNDLLNAALYSDSVQRKCHPEELDYWKHHRAYCINTSVDSMEISFVMKDPLPLIQVSVNGDQPAHFLIDTGGGELIIDTAYALKLGLQEFSNSKGIFGAGKKGLMIHSCIASLRLGDFEVQHLPAVLMDTRKFSGMLYGNQFQVDGIIGTAIFNNFLTTLDYAGGKIIFEIVNGRTLSSLDRKIRSETYQSIPFWMAADHYIVSRGSVNHSREMLFFVDTGLAGMSFTCPKKTLSESGCVLKKDKAGYGLGGGGKMRLLPFDIGSLRLGSLRMENLHGTYGAFPQQMEYGFGFHIGGSISHEFFRSRTVIFDFTGMKLHILP